MGPTLAAIGTKFLAIMSDLYDAAEVFTHEMHGHAPPASIQWPAPPAVAWAPGGFVLTGNQLNATTDRGPLPMAYDPPLGRALPVGTHTLTATLDTDEYEAVPETVTLVVNKAAAVINWLAPAAAEWQPDGFPLGDAQLNATTTPGGLQQLVYVPPSGDRLAPGTYPLSVSLSSPDYQAAPVQVTFVVDKAKATIDWPTPKPVVWTPGGFVPGGDQLNATTTPQGVRLAYAPEPKGLPVGTHPITVSVPPGEPYEAAPVTVDLVVEKLPVTINWVGAMEAIWAPGDFEPGPGQLNATTTPTGIGLTYVQRTPGKLPPGDHPITVSVADPASCAAESRTAVLTVKKLPAKITWKAPAAVDYVAGGITPGPAQLNAETTPPGARLIYSSVPPGPLGAGKHQLTATIDPAGAYVGAPATVAFTVNKARATIAWKPVADAVYVRGGYPLGDTELTRIDNPSGLALTFDPPKGRKLGADTHTLNATPADDNYTAAPATTPFTVKKARATIAWTTPQAIAWDDDAGAQFGDTQMTATTDPKAIDLEYSLDEEADLEVGGTKVTVSLDPREKGFEARAITVTITVTQTEEQKQRARHKRQVAKVTAQSREEELRKQPKLSRQEQLELEQRREEKRQRAVQLDQEEVEGAVLTSEYPIGAANVVPHIHSYPGGFHLKMRVNGRVKRMNLVQDGLRYNSIADTLATAWAYDQENATRIRKVLNGLLANFPE